jgi:glycosyltransferase involved in cell wall biosynthesis
VQVISLHTRPYAACLSHNLTFRLPYGLDLLIEDELVHPSLLAANSRPHPYPIISLVHHLRLSEAHPGWRAVERRYLASVDGFIFNSRTTRGTVQAIVGGTHPHLLAYPPTDRFGTPLTEEMIITRATLPGPLRLVFLGNLIPRKGLHTLLEAIASLPAGSVCLDVIGSRTFDRSYARKMEARVGALRLENCVRFLGVLEYLALKKQLEGYHVLGLPSSYEGFGMAYLEGMGFGLPAIATTAGAAGEIITDGITGYLVASGDASQVADRLRTLSADRDRLGRMSLNALHHFSTWPTWEQTADNINAFLVDMVGVHG